jgi:hypothetical protein
MPCIAIHLAVAKKYLAKNPNEEENDFILGTLAPDFGLDNLSDYININGLDKRARHFGNDYKPSSLIDYMKTKVDFNEFFLNNDINTSFLRAYFLHLLCDYYFFDSCINDNRLTNLSLEEGVKIGYNDYDLITEYLIDKYDLDIPKIAKDIMSRKGVGKLQILEIDKVDEFIDKMSKLDLNKEKDKLLKKDRKY